MSGYRGRFAPTPSGDLHLGSLIAALASFLQAKSQGGTWLLRIDDIDTPRVVPGSIDSILFCLEAHGLGWDEAVIFQSTRQALYQAALEALGGRVYRCQCSRSQLAASAPMGAEGWIYPGVCRTKGLREGAWRLNVQGLSADWVDRHFGPQHRDVEQEVGDFVLQRQDGVFSYHLSSVVDEFQDCITEVVRGADLLLSTDRHQVLQQLLGYPSPAYFHLPLLTNDLGEKLSKQTKAAPLQVKCAGENLRQVLFFLGQNPPQPLKGAEPAEILAWALEHWNPNQIGKSAQAEISLSKR